MGSIKMHKKFSPMAYYFIFDDNLKYAFVNKSTHPMQSARRHFNRAHDPNRKDYNEPLAVWLRSKPREEFHVTYSLDMPEGIERRAHLVELPEGFVPPEIISYETFYADLAEEMNVPEVRRKKSFTHYTKTQKAIRDERLAKERENFSKVEEDS